MPPGFYYTDFGFFVQNKNKIIEIINKLKWIKFQHENNKQLFAIYSNAYASEVTHRVNYNHLIGLG